MGRAQGGEGPGWWQSNWGARQCWVAWAVGGSGWRAPPSCSHVLHPHTAARAPDASPGLALVVNAEGGVGSGRHWLEGTAELQAPLVSVLSGSLFADWGSDLNSGASVIGNPAGEQTGFRWLEEREAKEREGREGKGRGEKKGKEWNGLHSCTCLRGQLRCSKKGCL
eukprot:1138290-Pelagomonas_calceolata.AAC.4